MATPTRPTALTSMDSNWSLGGIDLSDFGIVVLQATTRDGIPVKPRQESVPGGHGRIVYSEHYDDRVILLSGQIVANTAAQLQTNWDALKEAISTFDANEPRELRLIDATMSDRYMVCHYQGATLSEYGPRQTARMGDFTITLQCLFAESTTLTETEFTATTANTFQTITTGTFESPCAVTLTGAATNPKLIFGDQLGIWKFDLTTDFEDEEGNTTASTFSGTDPQEAGLFGPSKAGLGHDFHLSGAYTLTYSVTGNKDAGSWFFVVEPQFDCTETGTKVIFEHNYDANNFVRLSYVNTNTGGNTDRKFLFAKAVAGTTTLLWSAEQDFVSGDVLKVGFDYSSSGMNIYIGGSLSATNAEGTGLSSNPATVSFHQSGSNFSAEMKLHFAAGWSSALTSTEHSLVASDPEERVRNSNTVLQYTGTLAAGDLLTFTNRLRKYHGTLLDVSVGGSAGRSTVFPDATTRIPMLAPSNTTVHVVTTVATVNVQHQDRYL